MCSRSWTWWCNDGMSLAGDTTMMMMMMMTVTTQQTNAHTNGGENSTPASGGVINQSIINQFHLPHLCLRFCKYITHTHAHTHARTHAHTHTHTHTRLTALFPGPPVSSGTRKVKSMWILLKQETVSGSGISWAICKSHLDPDR